MNLQSQTHSQSPQSFDIFSICSVNDTRDHQHICGSIYTEAKSKLLGAKRGLDITNIHLFIWATKYEYLQRELLVEDNIPEKEKDIVFIVSEIQTLMHSILAQSVTS